MQKGAIQTSTSQATDAVDRSRHHAFVPPHTYARPPPTPSPDLLRVVVDPLAHLVLEGTLGADFTRVGTRVTPERPERARRALGLAKFLQTVRFGK